MEKLEKIFKTDIKYLFKNGFWIGVGQIVNIVTSFIVTVLFANLVSAETFGTYKYVLSIASFLAIPTLAGLDTSLVRAIAQGYEGNIKKSIELKLTWGSISFFGGLLVGIFYYSQGDSTLAMAIFIASAFVPFMEAGSLYTPILNGHKRFKDTFFFDTVLNLLVTVSLLGVIFLQPTLLAIVSSYFVAWTVGRVLILYSILKKSNSNSCVSAESLSLGKHLSLIKVTNTVASNIDRIILFAFLGPISVAAYSIAIAPVQQIKGLASVVKTISLPKFAEKNTVLTLSNYIYKLTLFSILLAGVSLLYIIVSPVLFNWFFPEYLNVIHYSQILAIGIIFSGFILNGSILIAKNQKKQLYFQTTVTYSFQIVGTLVGVYYFDIMGVVFSFVIAQVIYFILSTYGVIITIRKEARGDRID